MTQYNHKWAFTLGVKYAQAKEKEISFDLIQIEHALKNQPLDHMENQFFEKGKLGKGNFAQIEQEILSNSEQRMGRSMSM